MSHLVKLHIDCIAEIEPTRSGLLVIASMSDRQMFLALREFLSQVTDDMWTKWQKDINAECYEVAA